MSPTAQSYRGAYSIITALQAREFENTKKYILRRADRAIFVLNPGHAQYFGRIRQKSLAKTA